MAKTGGIVLAPHLVHFWNQSSARATGLSFLSSNLIFSSWAVHLPFIKSKLALDEETLGMALLAPPLGLLLMNPMTAGIIRKLGPSKATITAIVAYALVSMIPVWAPSVWFFLPGLLLCGMSSALLNVSVNTCAAWVEKREKMVIMSTCHGSWSLGGAIGSTIASLAYSVGVPPLVHSGFIVSITILLGLLVIRKPLTAISEAQETQKNGAEEKSGWMLPSGPLLMLIITGSLLFIGEGTAFDWSAIYMRDVLKANPGIVPLGYFAFAFCMAAMRFSGDWLIPRVGKKRVLIGSLLSAATGITLCAWATQPSIGILGFAVLGMGTALGAPILFSAAMQMPGITPAAGMATFSTFSFLGFLGGPPAIGFLAKHVGLSGSFLFVGVMLVLGALLASRLRL